MHFIRFLRRSSNQMPVAMTSSITSPSPCDPLWSFTPAPQMAFLGIRPSIGYSPSSLSYQKMALCSLPPSLLLLQTPSHLKCFAHALPSTWNSLQKVVQRVIKICKLLLSQLYKLRKLWPRVERSGPRFSMANLRQSWTHPPSFYGLLLLFPKVFMNVSILVLKFYWIKCFLFLSPKTHGFPFPFKLTFLLPEPFVSHYDAIQFLKHLWAILYKHLG